MLRTSNPNDTCKEMSYPFDNAYWQRQGLQDPIFQTDAQRMQIQLDYMTGTIVSLEKQVYALREVIQMLVDKK